MRTFLKGLMQPKVLINLMIISIIALMFASSETTAKFVMTNKTQPNAVTSTPFFFTSDYLTKTVSEYDVLDINGLDVTCYNYDIENTAHTSAYEITYDVTLSYYSDADFSIRVNSPYNISGDVITQTMSLSISAGNLQSSSFNVPFSHGAEYVLVEATSKLPYEHTISAKLTFDVEIVAPSYTVEDNIGQMTLYITTGSLALNSVQITWPTGYDPDTTDPLMSQGEWTNPLTNTASLTNLQSNTMYILDFFGIDEFTEVLTPVSFTDYIVIE